jgi:hypothetical protein
VVLSFSYSSAERSRGFTPKASITWNATNDIMVYALGDKGFRYGGANVNRASRIRSGWPSNSTPRKTRVRKLCIPSAMLMAVPGRISAGPGGPAESALLPETADEDRYGKKPITLDIAEHSAYGQVRLVTLSSCGYLLARGAISGATLASPQSDRSSELDRHIAVCVACG